VGVGGIVEIWCMLGLLTVASYNTVRLFIIKLETQIFGITQLSQLLIFRLQQ